MTSHVVRNRFRYAAEPVIHTLRRLGLLANLKLCLDAGDRESYATGQSWLDRSGGGYDFFLGADGNATATDPTINGPAHGRSRANYFSFDAGDYFRYDTTNETWMQNLHKDNALLGMAVWLWMGSLASASGIFGTRGASSNTGIAVTIDTTPNFALSINNAGAFPLSVGKGFVRGAGAWSFCAVSVDEAAGSTGGFFLVDDTISKFTATYDTPAAGDASFTAEIGARGNANLPIVANSRMGMFCIWEQRAPSLIEMVRLRNATRGRFVA